MNFTVEVQKPKVILEFDESSWETIEWMRTKNRIHALFLQLLISREKNRQREETVNVVRELQKLPKRDAEEILAEIQRRMRNG